MNFQRTGKMAVLPNFKVGDVFEVKSIGKEIVLEQLLSCTVTGHGYTTYDYKDLHIDTVDVSMTVAGEPRKPPRGLLWDYIVLLVGKQGNVVTKLEIAKVLYNRNPFGNEVNMLTSRLRHAVPELPVSTINGIGVRLDAGV